MLHMKKYTVFQMVISKIGAMITKRFQQPFIYNFTPLILGYVIDPGFPTYKIESLNNVHIFKYIWLYGSRCKVVNLISILIIR